MWAVQRNTNVNCPCNLKSNKCREEWRSTVLAEVRQNAWLPNSGLFSLFGRWIKQTKPETFFLWRDKQIHIICDIRNDVSCSLRKNVFLLLLSPVRLLWPSCATASDSNNHQAQGFLPPVLLVANKNCFIWNNLEVGGKYHIKRPKYS